MSRRVAVTSVVSPYVSVPIEPHRDLKRSGQPTPDGWERRFLDHLAAHGTGWLAAKQAGVAYKTVQRLRAVDLQFADDEQDAIREHAEKLESNLNRIADGDDMPAVTANIVRLKKVDPHGYVEKNLTVTATFSAELDPEQGAALLSAMLHNLSASSTSALTGETPSRVLPAADALPQTRSPEPPGHDAV